MKKLLKLFGILIAVSTIFCLSACDLAGLLGDNGNTTKQELDDEYYNNPIEHTFVRAASDSGYIYCHYDAQNTFTYGNHTNCYYQIEFSYASPIKFSLYTRKKGSMELIETIANGTITGDPWKEGVVTFTTIEGKSVFQTITIKKDSNNVLYFNGDVSVTHKALGAKDEK